MYRDVHEVFPASVRLLSMIALPPSGAVIVAPVQVDVRPSGVATTTPSGKVSGNEMSLNGVPLGLAIVKVG